MTDMGRRSTTPDEDETVMVSFRCSRALKRRLEAAAAADRRPWSQYLRILIEDALAAPQKPPVIR
jgi:hypothetical protein